MMHSKTILIVDDEPKTRQGLKKTLGIWSEGKYEIICAESAKEAIHVLERQRVHLLITDICMPEISGLKMLEKLNMKEQKLVVIILSGFPEFDYAQQAIRLGVVNYLLKPINKRKLIESVEKAMEVEANQERVGMIEKLVDDKLLNVRSENYRTQSPIKEALRFVDENIKGQLSLRDVANHVHLNSSYLSVLFKEQTNLTFSEYVTRRRLENAKKLLMSTNLTVDEIAHDVGYQTAKYFIKLFKEFEKMTPSRFRKSNSDNQIQ
ncbi:two component transcriptional regulator, AraC family [Anaerovirgula multivorans]|uniref:Stage 0 sporulation protein A homolog n=1 Tax=Anaerovirgula multivorans TaxID=312168 RepID=A0A239GZU0_9FIRM|nr:response regulator [Anaerovirgula multivorans]SNS74385.1 two component transcriptional regulator, AraC family [Anaerovirgula multivorans]